MNTYEMLAREKKVSHLVPVLIKLGERASRIEQNLDNEEFWRLAAVQAQVKLPSMETRKAVVEKLKECGR